MAVAKQFEGFNKRSLYSKTCSNRDVKWRHSSRQVAFRSLQCADCFIYVEPGQIGRKDLLKSIRRSLKKKAVKVAKCLLVSSGQIPFSSEEGKKAIISLTKTNSLHLDEKGKGLHLVLKNLNDFTNSLKNMSRSEDYDKWFDVTFRKFYKDHGSLFRKSVIFDVLVNGMNRMQGKSQTNPYLTMVKSQNTEETAILRLGSA